MNRLTGIVEHWRSDHVVEVWAGTSVADLQRELAATGQALPLLDPMEWGALLAGVPGTVGGLVAMNLPHGVEAQHGSVRDWVLGASIVRADGAVARSGSRVVKSVAGYDVHRLMAGARGWLGVLATVTLRTYSLRAISPPAATFYAPWSGRPLWIQRVLPSDFERAAGGLGESLLAADPATATLWAAVEPDHQPQRFDHDWALRSGAGRWNLAGWREDIRRLMRLTKQSLDPDAKFNPGVWGVLAPDCP
jgi:glycolate oxidase FAD binding subunit